MDLDSGVEIRSQPNTDPVIPDNVRDIIFIPSRKVSLECLSNDCLPSTDCCYTFRLINHKKEYTDFLCEFIIFSWAVSQTVKTTGIPYKERTLDQ